MSLLLGVAGFRLAKLYFYEKDGTDISGIFVDVLCVWSLLKLVLEGRSRAPPPLVALLRHVGLLPQELPVAQVPAQARRRVALPALARQRLHLGKMKSFCVSR